MKRHLLLLAVAASVATPTAAQLASGQSGSSTTSYVDGQEAWRTLAQFGRCYAKRNKVQALALIATQPDSAAERNVYREMFRKENQSCLSLDEMSMPVTFVRGAIAEGLYREGSALPADMLMKAPGPGAEIRTLSEATLCYAAAKGDTVRALLADTGVSTKKEQAAVQALMPGFAQCLPRAAAGRQFNATQLRFRFAEALLRLGVSPAPLGSASQ